MKKYRAILESGYQEFKTLSEAEAVSTEVQELDLVFTKITPNPDLVILAKILELETIPRAIREMGVRLGDEIAIAEENAIKLERNKLTGE